MIEVEEWVQGGWSRGCERGVRWVVAVVCGGSEQRWRRGEGGKRTAAVGMRK